MRQMVRSTQEEICTALGRLDRGGFKEDVWQHREGGGGVSRVLQDGEAFEKAGVNWSAVHGTLSQEDHVGVYSFMEKVKPGPNRVNVEELEPYMERGRQLNAEGAMTTNRTTIVRDRSVAPIAESWSKRIADMERLAKVRHVSLSS